MTTAHVIPLTVNGHDDFDAHCRGAVGGELTGLTLDTVQVNIGLACNLACHHCHVSSSPQRTERMDWTTMQQVLEACEQARAATLDVTGGAPEMHPDFRRFVDCARGRDLAVMVRTNLTIMLQEGYQDLPEFLADRRVQLVASLPCYLAANVDKQRGRDVYRDSIDVIRRLNAVGYGHRPELPLDLVYNPGGPSLPGDQADLERAYRRELDARFGLRFTRLHTMTNMPIGRFLHDLQREGGAEPYARLLRDAFNPATLDGLMCRRQLHVGWDGTMYDCDFNFALSLPATGSPVHVRDFDGPRFVARRIATAAHCFGCTAGGGSSCGGALV